MKTKIKKSSKRLIEKEEYMFITIPIELLLQKISYLIPKGYEFNWIEFGDDYDTISDDIKNYLNIKFKKKKQYSSKLQEKKE